MKKWTIYKIINPLKEVYIGRTGNYSKRKSSYKKLANCTINQKLLHNSLKVFGFESHTLSIIEEFVGIEKEADSKEMFWIRTYMSNRHKYPEQNGLNLTNGGGGLIGFIPSEETRNRLSAASTGRMHTEKTKLKMSLVQKGRKVSEETRVKISKAGIGRIATLETRKKLSEKKIGVKKSDSTKEKMKAYQVSTHGKIVNQYDLNGNFIRQHETICTAAKAVGATQPNMTSHLKGKHNKRTIKGFVFKYA